MIFKKIQLFFGSFLLQIILNTIFLTCKWKIHDVHNLNNCIAAQAPLLICSWHQRFIFVAQFFKNFNAPIWAISSTHKDSEIMAKILKNWKWKLIRGSSTRGWRNVVLEMTKLLKKSTTTIAITNDGPKGPAKIAKKGSLSLAIRARASIVAISCTSTSFWQLTSWDKTYIPKPFSTIHVKFSDPLQYNSRTINEVEVVGSYLNKGLEKLDKIIKK